MLASDADRERTLRRLRDGHVEGLLGGDTFERRIELALHARRRSELDVLLDDLPRRRDRVRDAVTAWPGQRAVWADAVAVELPAPLGAPVVVGRSRSCDVRIAEPTVSARHLELRPLTAPGRWLAVDLGSLNGTWAGDRRVARGVVRSGEVLLLGDVPVVLDAP